VLGGHYITRPLLPSLQMTFALMVTLGEAA
jgi:hypothetical protein